MDDRELQRLIDEALIDFDEQSAVNPTCIRVQDRNWGTLSNFSCIIGKPKAKKSFLVVLALAAAMAKKAQGITVDLPSDNDTVLLFDTEQSRPDVVRSLRRVAALSGQHPFNLKAYGLRKYPPAHRFEAVEKIIDRTEGVGLVVIDGIKDLVTSINDEEQATKITSALLRWTEERNIHVVIVLHQNKGDLHARGHVGTEITNKAETVISVTVDKNDPAVSHVKCDYSRDREFEPFSFRVEMQMFGSEELGVPKVIEGYAGIDLSYQKPRSIALTDDQVISILNGAFQGYKSLQLKDLTPAISQSLKDHGISAKGKNTTGRFKTRAEEMGILVKVPGIKGYPVYEIKKPE